MNEGALQFLESLPHAAEALDKALPGAMPNALDLVRKLLSFNPGKRITAAEAQVAVTFVCPGCRRRGAPWH